MNKFRWGNMGSDDVTIEENNRRQISIIGIREMFARLAVSLIEKGETNKAQECINKCLEITPAHQVFYDQSMLPLVEAMYDAGMEQKAVEVSEQMCHEYEQILQHYLNLKNDGIIETREPKIGVAIVGQLAHYAIMHNQNTVAQKLDKLYQQYSEIF